MLLWEDITLPVSGRLMRLLRLVGSEDGGVWFKGELLSKDAVGLRCGKGWSGMGLWG